MKMDGRDSAECQNWEKRDMTVIFRKVFKSLNAKLVNSIIFPILKTKKRDFEPESLAAIFFEFFFFRERNLSLKIRRIRPSAVFGTRREAALRGAAYAWVSDL